MKNTERDQFERLCSENGHNVERIGDEYPIKAGDYKDAGVQALWDWHNATKLTA